MIYSDITRLQQPLRFLVEAELQSGERITWLEQPIPGRVTRGSIPIVLFGIPWTAFALFWTFGAAKATHGEGIFSVFPLFGVPFILIGLGLLSSPFWLRRIAANTVYILSDRRAIIFRGKWFGGVNVRSFAPEALIDLRRNQNADGSGDLIFCQETYRDSDGDRRINNIGFMSIRDVKSVEEMVRAMAQRRR